MKNIKDEVFGKLNRGVNLFGLRDPLKAGLLIILISINTLSFSQINYKRIENAKIVFISTGDTLSSHSSDIEAIQQLQNSKIAGLDVKMLGAVYELDIETGGPPPPPPPLPRIEIEVDTFTTIADYILLDYTNSLMNPTIEAKKYALITNIGLAEIEADTIYRFQSIFHLERTRNFKEAKTTYKSYGLPFQFRDSLMLEPRSTSYRLQTFATKLHCVSYYLDNQEYHLNRSCNPGKLSDIEYRHTMLYENLDPDTEYLVRIEGTSEVGEFDFVEFKIKTLK
ncbi:unnamed protein product [marine sediment metagenome]|uniref:Uncharacterized protein n=1 Tax=marine sediment metagenome TaxID=412755 RepID=X0RTE4_9ZZZZ